MKELAIIVAGLSLLAVSALVLAFAVRAARRLARSLAELSGRVGEVEAEAARLGEAQAEARRELEEERQRLAAAREAAEAASASTGGDELWVDSASGSSQSSLPETPALPPLDETDVYSLALHMEEYFNRSTYPRELGFHENFAKGVGLFRDARYRVEDLTQYARGSNTVIACMALQAVAERADGARALDAVLYSLNDYYYWVRHYALEVLRAHAGGRELVADLLVQLNSTWADYAPVASLRDFVKERVAAGERVAFGERLYRLTDEQAAHLSLVLNELRGYVPASLIEEFERWRESRVDTTFMRTIGRVYEPGGRAPGDEEGVVVLEAVAERVAEIETALRKNPPRSVMVVGDSGTGKTTVIRVLAERFMREGWTILEASGTDVLAGQKYIGELEGRVQTLVRQIAGRRVLWVIPNFHEILWAGQHQYSPVGVLDMLLPSIESGELKVVGELTSVGYENLIRRKAKLRTVMQTVRVTPLSDAETLELARRWAERRGFRERGGEVRPRLSDQTLQEAFQLTKQYLSDKAAPGNLILLLDSTHRRLLTETGGAKASAKATRQISLDDLLVTLSQLTGLPVQILDDRAGLDLTELRDFFERRVLGQAEAVECLTERVAMIKAGLTDPTRPQGVFLFVGPTGTGKTEIAKTLAEFLFGSPDRMIRLDMSEFQTAESLDRIIGEASEHGDSQALVNSIRKQPFSVILLDEFEKAHPNVWDLFLQVFDDGRLTDRRGNTADFRHSVVIMTSNLGATLPHGASIGFSQEQAQFASGSVERAVGRAFRREFINRIDRVVVFRPLGLSVMRDLLRKELQDVLSRRGFRMRQWAVEWDESAIDFLLQKGFTADLGARPLKRAVERYVLSPLALTIVNHQFPEGDQFLFVRARDGRIHVQFIDPDAPEKKAAAPPPQQPLAQRAAEDTGASIDETELRLSTIALDARGTRAEVEFLEERYQHLRALADSDEWRERKNAALLRTSAPDFWDSPERFSVLGLAEYMDRIEAGLDTAGSLLARLTSGTQRTSDRKTFLPELVCRVAQQLYLLDAACRAYREGNPRDAYLSVQAVRETGAELDESNAFARRVAEMYGGWAEKRRMRFEVIEEAGGAVGNGNAPEPYRLLAAVSGFAAYTILSAESGLHVLETPQDEKEKSFHRAKVQVRVVAQPEEPAGRGREAQRRQAERAFAAEAATPPSTVRRYREEPSPLVRDSARGWRTGKLERVLAGDFDLF
ncbi:MAG TPA: AAA family ATPase [Pyrinomonadaceae bacterium]|nr:AAA family ATPase [Pyrinomonadaceae bacterium]